MVVKQMSDELLQMKMEVIKRVTMDGTIPIPPDLKKKYDEITNEYNRRNGTIRN